MRPADTWKDYELLDATDGNRLERWGETLLVRPDPQVVWKTPQQSPLWAKADAVYHRSNQGGGEWEYRRRLPEKWKITCGEREDKLTLIVSPTGFKHTGVFPEQAVNWAWYAKKIRAAGRPIKVLNLFGYTGGATLACAAAGATVCHVDASKGIVAWGKDNAAASGLADRPIRWLVDDCAKFVAREKRRGNTYDGIIMDPPSYGRGPGGEIWKLEDCIYDLMRYDDDTDDRFQYTYGANGEVARVKDCARDVSVLSEYDAANRPRRKTVLEGDKHAYTGELVYDAYDNVKTFKEQVGENREKYTTTFTHDEENRPTLMTFGDNQTVTYTYDGLGRVSERSANAGGTAVTTAYTYLDGAYGSNSTTPLVRTMTQAGTELTYTYDETGNIAGISDGQQRITYVYDLLGQLIRVNDPYDTTAGTAGTTWVFAYDHGGNIQKKTAYAYTTGSVGAAVQCDTFAYTDTNWKDKLTALNLNSTRMLPHSK